MCENAFCLGEPFCSEWETCSWMEPRPKRSKTESSIDRFPKPCSSSQMKEICQGYIPRNTNKATNRALKVFQSWREQRGEQQDGICPVDLLEANNAELLNFCLSRFVVEARREDGKSYPPATIHNLLSGIYRYSKSRKRKKVLPSSDYPQSFVGSLSLFLIQKTQKMTFVIRTQKFTP